MTIFVAEITCNWSGQEFDQGSALKRAQAGCRQKPHGGTWQPRHSHAVPELTQVLRSDLQAGHSRIVFDTLLLSILLE